MQNTSNIKKMFKSLLIIQLFLNIVHCLCEITSGYIAGNFLDSIAVSCNSLINPYSNFIVGIATIFSTASEILCGKYMGVGDKKQINKTYTNAVSLALILGIIITFVSIALSGPIIQLMAGPEIYEEARLYFIAYSLGTVSCILMPILANFLHMENEGKYVTASLVVLTVSYICFGCLLIKVLNWSYFGFGLTNSLSVFVTTLFLLIRIIKNKDQISFDVSLFDIKQIKEMLILGFPAGTAGMMIGLRNAFTNGILMEEGGVVAVAARSVMGSCGCIVDAFVTSTISAIVMISSVCVGEKNKDELVNVVRYFFGKVLPFFIVIVMIHTLATNLIVGFYTKDIEVAKLGITVTKIYYHSTVLEIVSDTLISIYTIYGYKKFVNIFNACHCFIIHTLFAFVFKNILGVYSVYIGYIFTEITCLILIFAYISYKNKKFPSSFEELILGKENFEAVAKYNKTISEANEIVNISKGIQDFLEENGIDHRRASMSGLLVEESAANIFEHGYTKKDVEVKRVDIFVMSENDKVNIRIRDNSLSFNPTTRTVIFNPEDPCKNIGIRVISKLSDEITYQNLFGFNNLIIKI